MNTDIEEDCQEILNDDAPIYELIHEPIRLTPYDRRWQELRDLKEKHEAFAANADGTDSERFKLAILERQIAVAQERFEREIARGTDDVWRERHAIDEHRSGAGREAYNAGRRKVRSNPNESLSDLSPVQKDQRKKYQRADANWKKRKAEAGWTEEQIAVGLAMRIDAREGLVSPVAEAPAGLEDDPEFGIF